MADDQTLNERGVVSEEGAEVSAASEVERLREDLKRITDRAAYLAADVENVRRRSAQDLRQQVRGARAVILLDVLSVLDNFERSFADLEGSVHEHSAQLKAHLAGFELIYRQLKKAVADQGVEEIPATQEFNPELHEAVMQVAEGDAASGEIVSVLEKGYLLHGELLRPAKVSVKS